MSEPDVTLLLNRAAANTPPMDISVPGVVQLGRRRIQRRRWIASVSMTLTAVIATGAVWAALGGTGVLDSQEAPPASVSQRLGEPATQGETVWLLSDAYTVGNDSHGWPQLLDSDGSTFFSVDTAGDEHVSAGGVIYMGSGLRFWQEGATIDFYVNWQPSADGAVVLEGDDGRWFSPQEVVTIEGPEGVVTLVSVPADLSGHVTVGFRTDDGVFPISP